MSTTQDTHAAGHGGHEDHGLFHVSPWQTLVAVWLALSFLTGLTVWASEQGLGELDLLIAMVIAIVKSMLVALFFMHLIYDRALNRLVFFASLFFVVFFLGITMLDLSSYKPDVDSYRKDVPQYEEALQRRPGG